MRIRSFIAASVGVVSLALGTGTAHAEIVLTNPGADWEVYTSGRVGAFAEYIHGDPQPVTLPGRPNPTQDGIKLLTGPDADGNTNGGTASASRVRSGFLGNVLTMGVRHKLTETTTISGQISIWATTETDSERTYLRNFTDEREAYLKVDGPAGTLTVGRQLSLFSRGATEIDFLYGHQFGVGAPGGFVDYGPSGGHIGYGVLASVFTAGVEYATPSFNGLQLTVGYFDPAILVGDKWARTKLGRVETEATYDLKFGGSNKLHLFANGAYQKEYAATTDESVAVYGGGAGARLEVGPFHVGVAGHSGKSLGVNYFLNPTPSMFGPDNSLRTFDGAYVQTQLALTEWDFNVGWGITRAHQLTADIDPQYFGAGDNYPGTSYLKSQMGVSAVIVHHFSSNFHGAFDYFRSDQRWWQGEKQVLNSFNVGATLTW